MQYLEALVVAIMLVAGQSLWKVGVASSGLSLTKDFMFSTNFLRFFFSPGVLGGLVIYGFATFFYMYLLSKYQYFWIQSTVTCMVLIMVFVMSSFIFKEKINPVNYLGLVFLLFGVILIGKK